MAAAWKSSFNGRVGPYRARFIRIYSEMGATSDGYTLARFEYKGKEIEDLVKIPNPVKSI